MYIYNIKIAVFVEVVIRLKQDYILTAGSFIMIKVQDRLQILLLEVFLLQLETDLISLFQFMISLFKNFRIRGNFFHCLRLNFTSNTFQVLQAMLSEGLEELLVIGEAPLVESRGQHGMILALQIVSDDLEVINHLLNLLRQTLNHLKVVIELKLVDLLNLD